MHRKCGNINLCLLIALIAVLGASVISVMAINSKYSMKESNEKLKNRYIAESGIDLATGLFINYLSNRDFVISYEQTPDGSFSVNNAYSPYLIDEIKDSLDTESVSLPLIENECNSYLSNAGYLDFTRNGGVKVAIQTLSGKENFKLSEMCISPNFLIGNFPEATARSSKINPLYLTISSKFKGGEVMANVVVSGLKIEREPFSQITDGNIGNVSAHIDVTDCNVKYSSYQNYRRAK